MTLVSMPATEPRALDALEGLAPPGRFRHVLVCLDRSSSAEANIPYARRFAEAFGAKMTLLHVMPSEDGTGHEWSRPDALEWEIRRLQADQYLRTVRTSLLPSASQSETSTELRQGVPAERIVATAREIGADLTFLAIHGEGGARLGATTQHVLAHGSLLVTHPGWPVSAPPERILVPLDGSTRAESVLPVVVTLARARGAEVILVHAVADPTPTALLSDRADFDLAESLATRLEANAERYLGHLRERIMRDVPVVRTLVLRRAAVSQALLEASAEVRADLIVLGAHGSTCDVAQPYGSVSSYLLGNARIPLLVLQDTPAGEELRRSDAPARPSTAPPAGDES